ncbi:hypothetical protein B0T14DRAFT_163272 [Immersiella caudata]|uniref:Uncharacterized protein n=1 Tax=Immersiella caudata TaxID=314043 RepID=A0AA39WWW6_9PEZI|nr:hypothetical protein B0T14DRAFT_163272 [Immersiella caudata]
MIGPTGYPLHSVFSHKGFLAFFISFCCSFPAQPGQYGTMTPFLLYHHPPPQPPSRNPLPLPPLLPPPHLLRRHQHFTISTSNLFSVSNSTTVCLSKPNGLVIKAFRGRHRPK